MEKRDTSLIKEKIIQFLERNGPSLPVHIAKEVGMDMIFTSAFLSELISHQKIKTSFMKVGTSPIYLLPGQEAGLEKFSEYIKGKEHEALILLKKNKFLKDSEQEPSIKVALRAIKDFAKPFEKNNTLIWRYFLIQEKEFETSQEKHKKEEKTEEKVEEKEIKKEETERTQEKKKKTTKKPKTKKSTKKSDEKFFNKVKEFLIKKEIKLSDILSFNKKDLILKIIQEGEEKILFAYNKKRITEKDILNAYKKASESGLNYLLFSLGEPLKKTQNLLEAAKKLDSIEKIE